MHYCILRLGRTARFAKILSVKQMANMGEAKQDSLICLLRDSPVVRKEKGHANKMHYTRGRLDYFLMSKGWKDLKVQEQANHPNLTNQPIQPNQTNHNLDEKRDTVVSVDSVVSGLGKKDGKKQPKKASEMIEAKKFRHKER